ncbi:MAG: DUF2986 domain-containing protein [Motiliproteus sp.]
MNRRKKLKSILDKRDKQANAKKHSSNKPRYIAKADREVTSTSDQDAETQSSQD